jgi:hypothetical protein
MTRVVKGEADHAPNPGPQCARFSHWGGNPLQQEQKKTKSAEGA